MEKIRKTEHCLPMKCIIPLKIRLNKDIPDAAKLYFGELREIINKDGCITKTDEELAKIKGVTISAIRRWNSILHKKGFIHRDTIKCCVENEKGTLVLRTQRKIYVFDDPETNPHSYKRVY